MCDVITMTSRINKLSRCGFNNRLKLTTNDEMANLKSFNRQVEKLVDDTYDVFQEIGEPEWAVLKDPFDLLIATSKDLLKAYRKRYRDREECEDLEGMVSYLMEIKSDIIRFRLPYAPRVEWEKKLDKIGRMVHERNQ